MISKHQVLEQRLASAVMREKNVMESIDSQFLLRMVSSFQDANYLYFVLDLVLGGELFELLYSNNKANSVNTTAFTQSAFYRRMGLRSRSKLRVVKVSGFQGLYSILHVYSRLLITCIIEGLCIVT